MKYCDEIETNGHYEVPEGHADLLFWSGHSVTLEWSFNEIALDRKEHNSGH